MLVLTAQLRLGLEQRDAVLRRLEQDHGALIAHMRRYAERLYRLRRHQHGPDVTVSSDDIREHLADLVTQGLVPPVNNNWMGSVFRGPQWQRVGVGPSRTPGRHASLVGQWVWLDRL